MRAPVVVTSAALLVGAVAYGVYWHHVAGELEAGIADWATQQRAAGSDIAFESDPISGFPLAFRTEFRAVALTTHSADGALSVAGERLRAEMRPWNLHGIHVASDQSVTATFMDGGSQQQLRLGKGTLDIALHGSGQLKTVTLAAAGADAETPQGALTVP